MGGAIFICLSPNSATSAITASLTATNISATAVTLSTSTQTFTAAGGSSLGNAYTYKLWIPNNTTSVSLTTSTSNFIFYGVGLYSNAYATGNTVTNGYFPAGQYVYLIGLSSSTSSATWTITSTQPCSGSGSSFSYDTSSGNCLNQAALSSGSSTSLSFTSSSSGGSYRLFTLNVPAASGSTHFYTLTVSFAAAFSGSVYAGGYSFMERDYTVAATQSFQNINPGNWNSGNTAVSFYYLMPGTTVYMTVYSSTTTQTATMTTTFSSETETEVVFGTTSISSSSTSATTSSPNADGNYYLITPFTVSSNMEYTVTVDSDGLVAGVVSQNGIVVMSSNFTTIYISMGTFSSSTVNIFHAPYLPAGSYYIVGFPGYTGARSNVVTATATGGNSSSAPIALPSMTLIFAIVATTIFSFLLF